VRFRLQGFFEGDGNEVAVSIFRSYSRCAELMNCEPFE